MTTNELLRHFATGERIKFNDLPGVEEILLRALSVLAAVEEQRNHFGDMIRARAAELLEAAKK